MRGFKVPLLGLGLVTLIAMGGWAQDAQTETAKMSYRPIQKWKTYLPSETWTAVGSEIAIPHAEGSGFACEVDGFNLLVDTNADGRTDAKVKGVHGFLLLRAKAKDGGKMVRAVRFRKTGETWEWATSDSVKGRVEGELVEIIDQNNNGAFNDFGVDAMVVGRNETASFLSRVVNLKGDLFDIDVTADGSEISYKPHAGESGTIDLLGGFKCLGQLEAAVVVNDRGDVSFNLARERGGMKVPVGRYTLRSGLASKGSETCQIKAGNMDAIEVKAGAEAEPTWGAPLAMEFDYSLNDGTLKVNPAAIHFYGSAGEEYFSWKPDTKSPKILVKDAETGRLIETARFGGC